MITPKVHLTLPENFDEDDHDEERHFAPILPLLEGLIKVNEWHLRRSLRRAQKGLDYPLPPLYASGVRYKEDPPGQENWKDIPAVLADGHGDCLPLSTLVWREDRRAVPLAEIKPGDRIASESAWTRVTAAVSTGVKELLEFSLSNGKKLRCSSAHRLFLDTDKAIRAEDVKSGMLLRKGPGSAMKRDEHGGRSLTVLDVADGGSSLCGDITTDTGRFWLPESDVIVHNCDRLVAWRVAELRVLGKQADPVIKWRTVPKDVMVSLGHPPHMVPDEGIQMVHVCVGLPGWQQYAHLYEQNPLIEDPSKLLGMGGSYTSKV